MRSKPHKGAASGAATTATIRASAHLGFGLSTTHVSTGSILGSGVGPGWPKFGGVGDLHDLAGERHPLGLGRQDQSNEGGSGPLARLCLAWPRRPARALWDLLDRSAVPLASTKGRTRLRLGIGEQPAVRHLDDQRARNRQAVRSRISLTSSIDVSGCRNTKRPTVSPSHLVGGTNAISSSCNDCAHLL